MSYQQVGKIEARAKSDNDRVYFQRVPVDVPVDMLPETKRLVEPLLLLLPGSPASLQAAAAAATAGAAATAATQGVLPPRVIEYHTLSCLSSLAPGGTATAMNVGSRTASATAAAGPGDVAGPMVPPPIPAMPTGGTSAAAQQSSPDHVALELPPVEIPKMKDDDKKAGGSDAGEKSSGFSCGK